jgi:hypothetical protein
VIGKRFAAGAMIAAAGISLAAGLRAPASATTQRAAAAAAGWPWRTVPGPVIPAPESPTLDALAMAGPSRGWAAGFTLAVGNGPPRFGPLLAAWDGRTWRRVVPRLGVASSRLDGLAARSATDAWAVGSVSAWPKDTSAQPLILHWNGRRWARVPAAPVPGYAYVELLSVAARSATDAWAVGEAQPATSLELHPVIEHWNGRRWRLMNNPEVPAGTALTSVTVAPDGQAWAAGNPDADVSQRGVVLHWTGRSWATAATPATSAVPRVSLDAVTMARNSVWAVGDAFDAHGNRIPYALRWNGRRWARVGVPAVAGGFFYTVTAAGHGEVIAGGIDDKGALSAVWNGRSWAVSTNPKITALNSLAYDGRQLTWATGGSNPSSRPVMLVTG